MSLDRIPACQGEAVRLSRIERETRKPLVERIHKGARCPRLRSEPQVRETLLPALPDMHREEELTPYLAENRFRPVQAQRELDDTGHGSDQLTESIGQQIRPVLRIRPSRHAPSLSERTISAGNL